MKYKGLKYLVVGCGFWGSVFAERIASVLNEKVVIIDKKSHIGGASYSEIDSGSGIEVHKYGSHIFHTSSKKVWEYVNKFASFNNYRHKVLANYQNKIYPMPINLATINMFYNLNLTPSEAFDFISQEGKKSGIEDPENFEQQAISKIGESLYEAFIKGYTQKQWRTEPSNLPKEIFSRLPVRRDYNFHYFSDDYEGIPVEGFGKLFENILSNKNIEIELNVDYFDIKEQIPPDCKIIYTGEVDRFFDYKYGRLQWRSLEFETKTVDMQDYQGTSVMNFVESHIPYTRIHEFKHFHPERKDVFDSDKTTITFEYPKDYKVGEDAYYPVNTAENNAIYELYKKEIENNKNLIVGGRLGAYKYWDMDKAIENALEVFDLTLLASLGFLEKNNE